MLLSLGENPPPLICGLVATFNASSPQLNESLLGLVAEDSTVVLLDLEKARVRFGSRIGKGSSVGDEVVDEVADFPLLLLPRRNSRGILFLLLTDLPKVNGFPRVLPTASSLNCCLSIVVAYVGDC